jgi:hypothetical protein
MSLFIGFVPVYVSEEELVDAFSETFSASVLVRLSQEKVKNETKYKSATVDIITSSRALTHFMTQIDEYGSNTFLANKQKYIVRHAKERVPASTRIKPYVM